jgi:hypothetical protein
LLFSLSWKYFLLVFIAVLGVLQGAAAHNDLRGLRFFRYLPASYAFSVLTVGFSLFVFFNWNSRYATGIIEGSQQVLLFTLAGIIALVCTRVVASVIRSSYSRRRVVRPGRLQALDRAASSQILRNRVNGRH